MADPTDPDVIASAPRPTVADQPAAERALRNVLALVGSLRARLRRGVAVTDQDLGHLVRFCAEGGVAPSPLRDDAPVATPPAIPADLRGLLDALVAAQDARDAADAPGGDGVAWGRCDAEHEDAAHAVAEWHRGAGDVDAEPAPAPLSDGELISLWGQYVGSPPSPNGMTLMRAIRDHAGGGR